MGRYQWDLLESFFSTSVLKETKKSSALNPDLLKKNTSFLSESDPNKDTQSDFYTLWEQFPKNLLFFQQPHFLNQLEFFLKKTVQGKKENKIELKGFHLPLLKWWSEFRKFHGEHFLFYLEQCDHGRNQKGILLFFQGSELIYFQDTPWEKKTFQALSLAEKVSFLNKTYLLPVQGLLIEKTAWKEMKKYREMKQFVNVFRKILKTQQGKLFPFKYRYRFWLFWKGALC